MSARMCDATRHPTSILENVENIRFHFGWEWVRVDRCAPRPEEPIDEPLDPCSRCRSLFVGQFFDELLPRAVHLALRV